MDTSNTKRINPHLREAIALFSYDDKNFAVKKRFPCNNDEVKEFMDFLDTLKPSHRKRITVRIIQGGLSVSMRN